MGGKELRISRIFNPNSGKAVIIPIDHGLIMGGVEGLTDPFEVLKKLINYGIDATLMSPGIGKITTELFLGKNSPARILTVDFPMISTIPGEFEDVISHEPIATVEYALRWNFDMVKVLLPWGTEREIQTRSVKLVSEFVDACDRWSMPLMVEPVLWGKNIPDERKNDPKLVENAARIALELGADVIKMQYTGNKEEFSNLVENLKVPVMVLGGPKMKSVRDVLKVAKEAVESGAKGIVFGRNVWQNPDMEKLLKALKEIVHEDAEPDRVIEKYGIKEE